MIFGCGTELLRYFRLGNGFTQQFFDDPEFILFFFADEGECNAVRFGPCRTADPVDIVLAVIGDIIIDHHFYIVDVDAAGKDIRGHEDGKAPALEFQQYLFAGSLVQVRMDLADIELRPFQLHGELFDIMFLRAEDEGALQVARFEQPFHERYLLGFVDDEGVLFNTGRRFGDRDIDLYRLMEDLTGQVADLCRHRGRKQQVLPFGRHKGNDLHDIIIEAHVQHTVGLVEDEVLEPLELDIAHVEMGDHPAGRTNDYIGPPRQGLLFGGKVAAITAAINGYRTDIRKIRQPFHVLCDLDGQFPRGDDHQCVDGIIGTGVQQLIDNGQQEGGRFTGAGLRGGNNILSV